MQSSLIRTVPNKLSLFQGDSNLKTRAGLAITRILSSTVSGMHYGDGPGLRPSLPRIPRSSFSRDTPLRPLSRIKIGASYWLPFQAISRRKKHIVVLISAEAQRLFRHAPDNAKWKSSAAAGMDQDWIEKCVLSAEVKLIIDDLCANLHDDGTIRDNDSNYVEISCSYCTVDNGRRDSMRSLHIRRISSSAVREDKEAGGYFVAFSAKVLI